MCKFSYPLPTFFLSIFLSFSTQNFAFCEDKSIKIGVILPLSGDTSYWGENSRKAITLAEEDLNRSLPSETLPIKLIVEDDRCDTKSAVAAAQKLISIDHVAGIVGAICSSSTVAIAPLAEKNRIPLISPCSEADSISHAGKFIYRTWPAGGFQAMRSANFARHALKLNSIAILSVENDFGTSLAKRFREEWERLGGKVVAEENYHSSDTDIRSQILRISSKKPQAIFLPSYMADGIIAVRQIKQLGDPPIIIGTTGIDSDEFLKPLGKLAEGIYFTNLSEITDPKFQKRFQEKFKVSWPGTSSCASVSYDALTVLAAALRQSDGDSNSSIGFLNALQNFAGVSGPITFDSNGDLRRDYGMFRYEDSKRVPLVDR